MLASDPLAALPPAADPYTSPRRDASSLEESAGWSKSGFTAVIFVAVFAAILSSVPARNSDLWMHLFLGRQLAHGEVSTSSVLEIVSGSRPYAAWLYDILCYGVYSAFGGSGLVLAKVALVVALALVVLRLSRRGAGWGIAGGCTTLVLLAMGPRFQTQPATVSFLFFALALYILRPDSAATAARAVTLAILFVLWASIDRGFVIGLGAVGLLWLGHALDLLQATARRRQLVLPIAFIVLLAGAYLVMPEGLRGYLVPPEFTSIASPLAPAALQAMLRSPAGLAYFALLLLGVVSFCSRHTQRSWQQFLPWFGLALLSMANVRAIPLFAVAAGPTLAWHLQSLPTAAGRRPSRRIGGRIIVALAAIGLLVGAWSGWLQTPFESRSWTMVLPAAPEQAAAEVRRWQEEGQLGTGQRTLHLAPATAYAFAWYCPQQPGLLDDRLAVAIRGSTQLPADWHEQLRTARIDHVIVYEPDRERLLGVLAWLLREPEQWPLLYLKGDLAIFGWRDPARRGPGARDPFAERELNLQRLAFQPTRDKRAPRKRTDRTDQEHSWWTLLTRTATAPTIDHDEAMLYLLYAEALLQSSPYRRARDWQLSQAAAVVGAASVTGVPQLPIDTTLHLALVDPPPPQKNGELPPLGWMVAAGQQGFMAAYDDVPPAVLYLAIRAARRALAVNPEDAQAHLVLGESYLRLLYGTRERLWGRRLPELVQLRRTQASTALNRAVSLDPKLAQAHYSLARLYQDFGYLDLALDHYSSYDKLLRAAAPGAEPDSAMEARQPVLSRLTDLVAEHEAAFEEETVNARLLDRALAAYRHGLAAKARAILLESDVAAFGSQGLRLELELLLRTGRSNAVVEWTSPDQKATMGGATYHWLRVQALAAGGDYALAQEECDYLADDARGGENLEPWQMIALLVGQAVLDEQPVGATVGSLAWRSLGRLKLYNRTLSLAKDLRQVANARVFRGLLALEQGNMEEAEVTFRLALAFWKDDDAAATGSGFDFNGRPVAEAALQWLP